MLASEENARKKKHKENDSVIVHKKSFDMIRLMIRVITAACND